MTEQTMSTYDTQQIYTVARGDSLATIAKQFYGDVNKWRAIWDANKSRISDPECIQVGQVLTIPDIDL